MAAQAVFLPVLYPLATAVEIEHVPFLAAVFHLVAGAHGAVHFVKVVAYRPLLVLWLKSGWSVVAVVAVVVPSVVAVVEAVVGAAVALLLLVCVGRYRRHSADVVAAQYFLQPFFEFAVRRHAFKVDSCQSNLFHGHVEKCRDDVNSRLLVPGGGEPVILVEEFQQDDGGGVCWPDVEAERGVIKDGLLRLGQVRRGEPVELGGGADGSRGVVRPRFFSRSAADRHILTDEK